MGLCTASLNLLACAKSAGADFSRSLMVGRQTVYASELAFDRVFTTLGVSADAQGVARSSYAEPVFRAFGAGDVESIDASSYENATVVHDLNTPIPDHLRARYTLVHDGGTLEHVFNFPQALKNCMEMVEVGGVLTQIIGANNMMGHGFWQISPELAYRAFSIENGFRVIALLMHESLPGGRWFSVSDPAEFGARIELCNGAPTFMLAVVQRVAATEVFKAPPHQSDYSAMWRERAGGAGDASPRSPASRNAIVALIGNATADKLREVSSPLRRFYNGLKGSRLDFSQKCYREISETSVITADFCGRLTRL
jgi:hypothetical protein